MKKRTSTDWTNVLKAWLEQSLKISELSPSPPPPPKKKQKKQHQTSKNKQQLVWEGRSWVRSWFLHLNQKRWHTKHILFKKGWSVMRVPCYRGYLLRGGVRGDESVTGMVHHGSAPLSDCLLPRSIIMMVCHHGGLPSGCCPMRVVCYKGGPSSRVFSCQGFLSTERMPMLTVRTQQCFPHYLIILGL